MSPCLYSQTRICFFLSKYWWEITNIFISLNIYSTIWPIILLSAPVGIRLAHGQGTRVRHIDTSITNVCMQNFKGFLAVIVLPKRNQIKQMQYVNIHSYIWRYPRSTYMLTSALNFESGSPWIGPRTECPLML